MSRKRVLIADDSPTVIKMLTFMLSNLPCDVLAATDGVEAIKLVYSSHPDLILLDILMPKMNGYQVCRLLKDDSDTRHIPIVMLTAKDQQSDRFWGLATGADEYLVKDFEERELLHTIMRYLQHETPHTGVSLTRKVREITTIDVLTHANHLLDRQLYQSTITNRINQLASSIQNFDKTILSVFELLGRIITYQIGALAILGTQATPFRLYLYLAEMVSPLMMEHMKARILKRFAPQTARRGDIEEHIVYGQIAADAEKALCSVCENQLIGRNHEIGTIILGDCRAEKFSEDDRETMRIASTEIAVVIDNARLYEANARIYAELEAELRRTSDIQKSMLPQHNPLPAAFTIEAVTVPAKVVGGDYYDYFRLNDHQLLFAIGDVTGKGVSAALMMAMVKTALQTHITVAHDPGVLMALLNTLVADQASRSQQYMTLLLGVIDTQAHTLTCCNAGHNFPYLFSAAQQTMVQVENEALPLGFLPDIVYPVSTYHIQPNDILFCYTDGVVEVMNEQREIFGYPRLEHLLRTRAQADLRAILTTILHTIETFCSHTPQDDDITMLLIQYAPAHQPQCC